MDTVKEVLRVRVLSAEALFENEVVRRAAANAGSEDNVEDAMVSDQVGVAATFATAEVAPFR